MADDDIAVTIEADEPVGTAAETKDPAVAELASQFEEMKTRVSRAEDGRAAALRAAALERNRAEEARLEVSNVRGAQVDSEAASITAGIDAATQAIKSAKAAIQTAGEAGDYAKQAEAYDELAGARARLERLNEAKVDVETRKTEAARPQARTEAQVEVVGDPVDVFLAGRTDPTRNWLRDHPDYARALATGDDVRKQMKLNAAHSDAMAEGIKLDTPEYFEHVESFLGLKESEPAVQAKPTNVPKPAPRRAPVAPVQGSNGSTINGGGTVRLSKNQAAAATDGTHVWNYPDPTGQNRWKKGDAIGIQEMARRVKAQTDQGLYRAENVEI